MLQAKFVVMLTCLITMAGCTDKAEEKASGKIFVNSKGIAEDSSLTSAQKAERLALSAEALMTPSAFMYADEVVTTALNVDPANKRAQFMGAVLKPLMVYRGILNRVRPIVLRDYETRAKYNQMIARAPNSGLKTFLLDGRQDIQTEREAQDFLGSVADSYEEMRQFFKDNKDMKLTVNIPDMAFQALAIGSAQRECAAKKTGDLTYEVDNCDLSRALQLKVNRADIEYLQSYAAAMEMYVGLYATYDISGTIDVVYKTKHQKLSRREISERLFRNENFGKLTGGKYLQRIQSMGIDAITGARWMSQNYVKLCPQGQKDPNNRAGFMFRNGMCVDLDRKTNGTPDAQTAGEVLAIAEGVLQGDGMVWDFASSDGTNSYRTYVMPATLLNNPVQDVRNLGAFTWDACDRVENFEDPTFGGVFAKSDANNAFAAQRTACVR